MASNGLKYHKKDYDQLFPKIQDGRQISQAVKWHILTERRIEGYIQYSIGFCITLNTTFSQNMPFGCRTIIT